MAFVKIPKDPLISKVENILTEIEDLSLSEARSVLLIVEDLISEEEEDLLSTPGPYDLTKAQAVRLLDRLYHAHITTYGLDDKNPDFHSLINENVRATHPPCAVKAGVSRGNRGKWGCIPHISQPRGGNTRIFFREADLIEWFNTRYLPVVTKAAA